MRYERNAATDAVLAELSRQALEGAADRLGVDPLDLARGLARGRLADLILELKVARYWAYPRDRDRIEDLLAGIDRRFMAPVSAHETRAVLAGGAAGPGDERKVAGRGRRDAV